MHKIISLTLATPKPEEIYKKIYDAVVHKNFEQLENEGLTITKRRHTLTVSLPTQESDLSPNRARSNSENFSGKSYRKHVTTEGKYQLAPDKSTMYLVKGTKTFENGMVEDGHFKWCEKTGDSILISGMISYPSDAKASINRT
jgi:hypothetical protein